MSTSLLDLSTYNVDKRRAGSHPTNIRVGIRRKLHKMSMMIVGVQDSQMMDFGKACGWNEQKTDNGYDNPPRTNGHFVHENGAANGHDADTALMLLESAPLPVAPDSDASGGTDGLGGGDDKASSAPDGELSARAPGPVDGVDAPEADDLLAKRGIFMIPDILCNAGGVFVSYLEYTQETQQEQMTTEEVQARLQKRMTERFDQVCQVAAERSLPMREAAMSLAIRTVCTALKARGYSP